MEETMYIRKDVLWIPIPDELDHRAADRLVRACDVILLDLKCRHVVFDFSKTVFMDSAGIGLIMGRYRQIRARGGKIIAYRPGKRVLKLMEYAGLLTMMDIWTEKE